MAEKRYYWLKLQDDFFSSKRIKKLRKLAGGDTYTIIYLKMQLMALKSGGVLEYTGLEPSFAEEIALDIDEEADNVCVAVNYLLSCGLLETSDEKEYFLPYVVLNTGKEGASAKRVREHRERKNPPELPAPDDKALHCNADVTQPLLHCYGEKEKETETEKRERVDYQLIADMYNETCVSFPRLKSLTEARKKAIKARLKTYSTDDFKQLFELAEASDFLKGSNDRNWSATFDWLIKDGNMAKVLEGNYANKAKLVKQPEKMPTSNDEFMAKLQSMYNQE